MNQFNKGKQITALSWCALKASAMLTVYQYREVPEAIGAGTTKSIPRSDVLPFRTQEVNSRKVGEILGVTYILEGSVRKVGQQIRVTAQLIDIPNRLSGLGGALRSAAGGYI